MIPFPRVVLFLLVAAFIGAALWWYPRRQLAPPPGVVITHAPLWKGSYIGSPSLAILPNGDYVACRDFFGPASRRIQIRHDAGLSGRVDRGRRGSCGPRCGGRTTRCSLCIAGALYLLGVNRHAGADMPKELLKF